MLGIVRDHCRFVVTQEVKSPLRVFVGTKRDKVGQGMSDVGTLIVRAVMGHDTLIALIIQNVTSLVLITSSNPPMPPCKEECSCSATLTSHSILFSIYVQFTCNLFNLI